MSTREQQMPNQQTKNPPGQPAPPTPAPPTEPAPPHHDDGAGDACANVPELTRLRYFYGQLLGADDFRTEQSYFREKLKLHNRCLHGYGVVCGLGVRPEPMEEDCVPPEPDERPKLEDEKRKLEERARELRAAGDAAGATAVERRIAEIARRLDCVPPAHSRDEPRTRVIVDCGLALDCDGNELVVRRPIAVDLLGALDPREARRLREGDREGTLYLSICFCEQPVGPVRPVLADSCGGTPECAYGKVRDSVKIRVGMTRPPDDDRCEGCCTSCNDACLVLARIDRFSPGRPLTEAQIHPEVRRDLAPYTLTRVAGVSWVHGAHYGLDDSERILQTDGLEIRFTRPVLTSTITEGVVDLWVLEGGGGHRADFYYLDLEVDAGTAETTDRIVVRQVSDDRVSNGDRVFVTVRTGFILDRCCYAVDGENVGGRVPALGDYATRYEILGRPAITSCARPPRGLAPWTSGDGVQAGTFESWFYFGQPDGKREA